VNNLNKTKSPVDYGPNSSADLERIGVLEKENQKLNQLIESVSNNYNDLQNANQAIRREYEENKSQLKSLELEYLKAKHLLQANTIEVTEHTIADLKAQIEFQKNEKLNYRSQRNKLLHLLKTSNLA